MADNEVIDRAATTMRDALDEVRTATQELHTAIRKTLAERAEATRPQVEEIVAKARETADLARSAISENYAAAQAQITAQLSQAAERTRSHRLSRATSRGPRPPRRG